MEFKILDKWIVKSDRMCVTVSEIKTAEKDTKKRKVGDTYIVDRWFYPSFETALEGLIDREFGEADLVTLRNVVEHIKKFKSDMSYCLEEHGLSEPISQYAKEDK